MFLTNLLLHNLVGEIFLRSFRKKKRPYLDIKNVCNVYETVCSPSTKCLTRYCRMKCQDFSLSYRNRAAGSCENPGRPILIDCLSLLLYFWCTANVYRQTTDELKFKSVISTQR